MMENEVFPVAMEVCTGIAEKNKVEAICVYGSRAGGYARDESDYDILLILTDYLAGVRYHYKAVDGKQLAILAVDKGALEADAVKGSFGNFIAGRLMAPYIPLLNRDYLEEVEFTTKKRFAEEDLEDLVIEYGELARGLVVKPEYLVLVRMRKRARAYPPVKYSYTKVLREDLREKNLEAILVGYRKALKELGHSKMINFNEEEIVFEDEYVDKILASKIINRVVNIVAFSKRAFATYLTHGKAGKVDLDVFTSELTSKLKRGMSIAFNKEELEDPKNYLFLKTDGGLSSLNEKNAIVNVFQQLEGEKAVEIKPLGSALNEVYLVTVDAKKFVVKKFTNWHNFKWFMLNIVTFGTKTFSLSGKARLANEYGINRLLAENNVLVPEVVTISVKDRVLVEQYIEGTPVSDILVKAFQAAKLTKAQKQLIFEIGKIISKIHALNVVVGDCKPENFIVRDDGKIYILDLEQGERKGDKTWDVAEFLYFSGHFTTKFTGATREFVEKFCEGYSQLGNKEVLKRAASFRYSRVFLGWTFLPILLSITSTITSL